MKVSGKLLSKGKDVLKLYLKYAGVYFMIALEEEISCIKVIDAH